MYNTNQLFLGLDLDLDLDCNNQYLCVSLPMITYDIVIVVLDNKM